MTKQEAQNSIEHLAEDIRQVHAKIRGLSKFHGWSDGDKAFSILDGLLDSISQAESAVNQLRELAR